MADYNLGKFRPNPKHEFNSKTKYEYFDMVLYNGNGYININDDLVDGISCVGILPEGMANSKSYWMCICSKGETGTSDDKYSSFITLDSSSGIWDYNDGDKVIAPKNMTNQLTINNAYNGCCGVLITENKNLELPNNSHTSQDFYYVDLAKDNEYYFYTFICVELDGVLSFLWNRTVMIRG